MKAKIMEVTYVGGSYGPTLEIRKENGDKIEYKGYEVFAALNTHQEMMVDSEAIWYLTFFTEDEGYLQMIPMKYPIEEEFNEKDLLFEAQEIMNNLSF